MRASAERFGLFINQGEVCSPGSRILVERSIYPKVLDAMVEKARTIRLGNGLGSRDEDGATGEPRAARPRARISAKWKERS